MKILNSQQIIMPKFICCQTQILTGNANPHQNIENNFKLLPKFV